MSEIFRISKDSLSVRRRSVAFVLFAVLTVVGFQAYKTPDDIMESMAVGIIVLGIAAVIAIRQYKQYESLARIHSLTMHGDHILFRDGDTERRMPYSCIEQVTLEGMLNKVTLIGIKCRDLPKEQLHGYENFPRLIELLLRKVPHASVRTRGMFMSDRGQ